MDVFSFGVVLLELVLGRELMDEEGRVLWIAAAKAFQGHSSLSMVDIVYALCKGDDIFDMNCQLMLKFWQDEGERERD
ncbi:hypothetical protein NL676_021068 [Syzygium grande]|nr:hypothetical protein NL676_021068 [Syzygium grande]